MSQTYALIANGAIDDSGATRSLILQYDQVIAVDGGLNHCHAMGITPNLIIGDMDSVSPELLAQYAHIPTQKFPFEKDETDLELALKAVMSPQLVKATIFGALGYRTDHLLANLHLIRRYPERVFIESERELIFSVRGELTIPTFEGQTISFLPLGTAENISSTGLKWELKNATFNQSFFSLSNICLADRVKISIGHGDLICIMMKI